MDPDQPAQSDQDPCCSLTNPITSSETDSEQHGSWSHCADAQAGLDPCWSQTLCWFCHNAAIIYIYFRATTDSVDSLSNTETMTINILNVNDNTPKFSPEIYYASIAENTGQGKLILPSIIFTPYYRRQWWQITAAISENYLSIQVGYKFGWFNDITQIRLISLL
jgi:hypothetical protein